MTLNERRPSGSARRRAVRGCAVAACMLAGCYRPARPDCAVSCADGAPCPSGLTCGATDQLCHAGAIECSAAELPPGDAATGDDAAPGIDARLAFCDPSQRGLIGCYEFENTANNALPGLDITVNPNVKFPPDGKVGRAAAFDITTSAGILENPRLDLSAFTIEAWVNPGELMSSNTSLVNRYFRYGMTLDTMGEPVCAFYVPTSALPVTAISNTPLTPGHWTHLACTYDGTTLVIYVDGVEVTHALSPGPVVTGASQGLYIGGAAPDHEFDVYVGRLDELRLFSAARTAPQICADAGRAHCP